MTSARVTSDPTQHSVPRTREYAVSAMVEKLAEAGVRRRFGEWLLKDEGSPLRLDPDDRHESGIAAGLAYDKGFVEQAGQRIGELRLEADSITDATEKPRVNALRVRAQRLAGALAWVAGEDHTALQAAVRVQTAAHRDKDEGVAESPRAEEDGRVARLERVLGHFELKEHAGGWGRICEHLCAMNDGARRGDSEQVLANAIEIGRSSCEHPFREGYEEMGQIGQRVGVLLHELANAGPVKGGKRAWELVENMVEGSDSVPNGEMTERLAKARKDGARIDAKWSQALKALGSIEERKGEELVFHRGAVLAKSGTFEGRVDLGLYLDSGEEALKAAAQALRRTGTERTEIRIGGREGIHRVTVRDVEPNSTSVDHAHGRGTFKAHVEEHWSRKSRASVVVHLELKRLGSKERREIAHKRAALGLEQLPEEAWVQLNLSGCVSQSKDAWNTTRNVFEHGSMNNLKLKLTDLEDLAGRSEPSIELKSSMVTIDTWQGTKGSLADVRTLIDGLRAKEIVSPKGEIRARAAQSASEEAHTLLASERSGIVPGTGLALATGTLADILEETAMNGARRRGHHQAGGINIGARLKDVPMQAIDPPARWREQHAQREKERGQSQIGMER